jgi:hypothetical protein
MKDKSIPEFLPTGPMTLQCPICGAKPGHDCETPSKVRLYVVHLARVKAVKKMDKVAGKRSHVPRALSARAHHCSTWSRYRRSSTTLLTSHLAAMLYRDLLPPTDNDTMQHRGSFSKSLLRETKKLPRRPKRCSLAVRFRGLTLALQERFPNATTSLPS